MTSLLLEKAREECVAWRPPVEIPVAQWCGENVFMQFGGRGTARAYDPWLTPYVIEILNAIADPLVEEIAFVASTQVGKTALELALIAWICCQRPGDILFVMPTEQSARDMLSERIKPMIELSPCLSELVSGDKKDWKADHVTLSGCTIHIGWAGSPTSLARRPLPNVIADECAKWPLFSKDEGGPLRLAVERTRWFPHTKAVLKVSTPKNEADLIWSEWEAGDKRQFYVPCPHCGEYQTLEFVRVRLKPGHEEERDPTTIIEEQLGAYVCEHCDGWIEESQKEAMVAQGVWAPEGCRVVDGLIEGEIPKSKFRSYRIHCVYSPLISFSEVLAEWFRSVDPQDRMNFVNSWLAEPWKDTRTKVTEESLVEIQDDYEEGTVHPEGQLLVAGVDVQRSGVYYVVRAYGHREKSWLVEKGRIDPDPVETELEKVAQFLSEASWTNPDGREFQVVLAGIDSGDGERTHEIYDVAAQYPHLFQPTKGWDHRQNPFDFSIQDKADGRRRVPGAIRLCNFSTDWFKTKLAAKINSPPKWGSWHIPRDASSAYRKSLLSEHKITTRNSVGATKEKWEVKRTHKNSNHWWDCEVMADLMAAIKVVRRLPDPNADPDPEPIGEEVEEEPVRPGRPRRRGERPWIQAGTDW